MGKAILLSGGIDSIALAYWKRPDLAITINYGQKPAIAELRSSEAVCKILQIEHVIIKVDCSSLGSGDLIKAPSITIAPSSEWWCNRQPQLQHFWQSRIHNFWQQGVHKFWQQGCNTFGNKKCRTSPPKSMRPWH